MKKVSLLVLLVVFGFSGMAVADSKAVISVQSEEIKDFTYPMGAPTCRRARTAKAC